MTSRLVNVRLDEERVRKARRLRSRGIALSDVVREAIDARYASLDAPLTGREAAARIARIIAEHPDPADAPVRGYDVHDAKAARAAIARSLGRRAR
jgi:hypothetical protein